MKRALLAFVLALFCPLLRTQSFELPCHAGSTAIEKTIEPVTGFCSAYFCVDGIGNVTSPVWGTGTSSSPPNTFPASITGVNLFGDSITSGYGLQNVNKSWGYVFARSLGIPTTSITDYAVPAAFLINKGFYPSALTVSATASIANFMLGNSNDLANIPRFTNEVVNADEAMLVWLALPATAKLFVTAGGMSCPGWSSTTVFGQTTKFINSTGATCTGTVNGTVIYVASNSASTLAGTGTIKVDETQCATINNSDAIGQYPQLYLCAGLTSGNHSVVVTSNGDGNLAVQWYAGNQGGEQTILVGYGATIPRKGFPAQPGILNPAVSSMITTLKGDGLNVIYVADDTGLSITASPTNYLNDLIHPNISGAILVANNWLNVYRTRAHQRSAPTQKRIPLSAPRPKAPTPCSSSLGRWESNAGSASSGRLEPRHPSPVFRDQVDTHRYRP